MIVKFKITVNDNTKVLNCVSRCHGCSLNVIFTVVGNLEQYVSHKTFLQNRTVNLSRHVIDISIYAQ